MIKQNDKLVKSRLGRILVNRGYINEDQLDLALKLQASENKMLGQVLIDQGLISEKDLKRTLKQQSRYRYTAAFIALATAPFQPMLAMAANPIGIPLNSQKVELSSVNLGNFQGLQALDDEEMSSVNAQGFGGPIPSMGIGMSTDYGKNADGIAAGLQHKYRDDDDYEEQDDEQIAYELADSALTMAGIGPISDLLDAKITIEGMKYQEGRSQIELLEGGKIKMYMPTEIARISIEDIRVKGNTSGPTMGSIFMSDIKYHPKSSYTISAK